jgi:hypothetical protein
MITGFIFTLATIIGSSVLYYHRKKSHNKFIADINQKFEVESDQDENANMKNSQESKSTINPDTQNAKDDNSGGNGRYRVFHMPTMPQDPNSSLFNETAGTNNIPNNPFAQQGFVGDLGFDPSQNIFFERTRLIYDDDHYFEIDREDIIEESGILGKQKSKRFFSCGHHPDTGAKLGLLTKTGELLCSDCVAWCVKGNHFVNQSHCKMNSYGEWNCDIHRGLLGLKFKIVKKLKVLKGTFGKFDFDRGTGL